MCNDVNTKSDPDASNMNVTYRAAVENDIFFAPKIEIAPPPPHNEKQLKTTTAINERKCYAFRVPFA